MSTGMPVGARSKSMKSTVISRAAPDRTEVTSSAPAVVIARFAAPMDLVAAAILTGTSMLSPGNAAELEIDRVYSCDWANWNGKTKHRIISTWLLKLI